jgi:DNA-binding response OmpR family regulator
MKPKILIVDDDVDYLDAVSRLFELHDFSVLSASTVAKAFEAFENKWFHLAIIDVRLENPDNPNDISGLMLAREPRFIGIPKIIVTSWPTWQSAVNSLKSLESTSGPAPAVDYIAKDIGFNALVEGVRRVLNHNLQINWDLHINWQNCDKFSVVNWIDPDCESHLIVERTEEFEDLFRRLFFEKKLVKIERVVWQDKGRVALLVTTFDHNDLSDSFIVTCGDGKTIENESSRYRDFAPKATGSAGTSLHASVKVNHFAANAYVLAGAAMDNLQSLSELYLTGQPNSFYAALEDLFNNTLICWGGNSLILKKKPTLNEVYLQRLGLNEETLSVSNLSDKFQALAAELRRINLEVAFSLDQMFLRYGSESFIYPDPLKIVSDCRKSPESTLFIRTPGRCTGNNILTDFNNRTWITDFGYGGLAPSYWNHLQIEAEIRFDWTVKNSVQNLHEMEQVLVRERFSKFNLQDFETALRKPARAILIIRKLVQPTVGKDHIPYHIGILFHALSRITSFRPAEAISMSKSELVRAGHALLSISIIGEFLLKNNTFFESTNVKAEIRIDISNREVWLGSKRLKLQPQSFEILCILYNRPNQLCSRAEFIEHVFKENFEEDNESQINRLNSAIFRLRQQIEDDPNNPQYIVTESKSGYRLNLPRRRI